MGTYRLDLQYDGSGFHGFARNPGVRTIQSALEDALSRILGEHVGVVVAGRTDAGVHAIGQVVSFEVEGAVDVEPVTRSLRSMLAPEIAIVALEETAADFHARFSATGRTYRYFVDDTEVPNPLLRSSVWHVRWPLDLDAMNAAAAVFVGSHDFASMCRPAPGKTTERTVRAARWTRTDELFVFEIRASAFCHQMVRSIVAVCVDAGRGKISADSVPEILAAADRNTARGAAPAHGLVLWEVVY